ncbi:hypothetical protein TNIN_273541 [Trichonephila inaurata madagascariensis]|uniref:Uncharacterized protein n=1 Tax=Trichonephila inaurata madagascariensis TaxID=2747483 RepID=A0A8X7CG20_9ARAC|nr:hypothetical protein TNIN_273541 [Trichonephila inaurata madagascariensis]
MWPNVVIQQYHFPPSLIIDSLFRPSSLSSERVNFIHGHVSRVTITTTLREEEEGLSNLIEYPGDESALLFSGSPENRNDVTSISINSEVD